MEYKNSDELCEKMAEKHNGVCLLAFSRGKDSIASFIKLKRYFHTIIPYHLSMLPEEMSFEKESLKYYEDIFETKIERMLSPSFFRMINKYILQIPERLPIIDYHDIKNYDYKEIQNIVKAKYNLPKETMTGIGVTQFDSFRRQSTIRKNGAVNLNKCEFFPIFDMKKLEIFSLIDENKIKYPVDYDLYGKSFDGFDYRFLKPLKEKFPADYDLIKFWFPLIDLEIMRYELHK